MPTQEYEPLIEILLFSIKESVDFSAIDIAIPVGVPL